MQRSFNDIMNRNMVKSLLLAVGCGAGAALFAADADAQRGIDSTVDAYSVNRQEQESAADTFIDKGNKLFIGGNYKDAALNYAQAAYIFESLKENSDYFKEKLEKTKELIAKSYYYLAQETALKAHEEANVSELENAIALCKEAIVIYPAAEKELTGRIEVYEKMRAAAAKRAKLSEDQVIPGLGDQKYRIAVLLKQAKILYYTRQYEQARRRYQDVLLIDKINPEAIQGLRAANIQIKKAGEERYAVTHKRDMVEAAWKTVTPIVNRNASDVRQAVGQSAAVSTAEADESRELREKLKSIIIPRVNFSGDAQHPGTPLLVALKFLRDRSKANDPTGEGVNIFLYYPEQTNNVAGGEGGMGMGMAGGLQQRRQQPQLGMDAGLGAGLEAGLGAAGRPARPARPADNNDEDEEEMFEDGAPAEAAEDHSKYPLVNLDLINKPLIEIIDALAQATKMKYKIEKHAVVLAPLDAPLDDMQIKVFLFDQNMIAALGGSESPQDLQSQLETYGVPFPSGSKVMFDPKFRVLIALNTPENLDKINDVILEIRKQDAPPLVQIQVKFVEVEQSDLKELGFIQTLGRPNGANGATNGRLQFDTNDVTLYNSGANTFTYSRTTDGYNYNLTVNALNQLDSKDILSSPKVLTNPGKKVSIKMTSERYFEWDYDEGEFESNNSSDSSAGYTYTPPWPTFEMQELGISMEVTPTVDTEKRLIMMNISPWVRTLVGWTAYNYTVSSDDNDNAVTQTETMKRPIIAERTTDTNVSIYDNETVVIGGIIKDYTVLVDDKIPFLGDIPLVGNFFKSKSSSIQKTNLLIFVTARMLKPDGSPYYQFDTRGRPSAAGLGDIY